MDQWVKMRMVHREGLGKWTLDNGYRCACACLWIGSVIKETQVMVCALEGGRVM